jgi:ribosomal-protein-alanine N-acetyltransferase
MASRSAAPPLPETLRTERLVLRLPAMADARAIFDGYAQDAEVSRYLIWRPHASIAETRAFLRTCVGSRQTAAKRTWTITSAGDGGLLGMIDARLHGFHAEIGYALKRSAWGRGLMTEASRAVVEAVLHVPGMFRVAALCDVDNVASARVLEKVGMLREGILRRRIIHPNLSPEPRDVYCYARTR